MPVASLPAGFGSQWWIGVMLCGITLAAYIPVIYAGYIWDDDYHVHRNLALRSFDGLLRLWHHIGEVPQYYPLTHTSFWIEYQLWGNNPAGYHITNVLLHAVSSVILWRLLLRMRIPAAPFIAALFAVHPVCVESVAWITERKNVLSGVFYLLAASMYWRAIGEPDESREPRVRWYLYAAAAGLLICALLSKTVASTLPAAMLLVLWYKRGRLRLIDLLPPLPLFVVGAGFGSLTKWMEHHIVGAFGPEWDFTIFDRILIAGRALWFYLGKLLWPTNLTFIYPRWDIDPFHWQQWLYPAAAVAVVLTLFFARRRIGRGPVTAALFFCGTLTPALGFFNVFPMRYSFVADHFQYLASIGIFTLISVGIATTIGAKRRILAATAGVCVVLVMAGLTFLQTWVYADAKTLWIDTLNKNPGAWMAAGNLAKIYISEAEALPPGQRQPILEEARNLLEQATRQKASSPMELVQLGCALSMTGDETHAMELWNSVMAMRETAGPRAWPIAAADAQFQIGRHYQQIGDYEQAINHFREALQIAPSHIKASIQLASLLASAGQFEHAWPLLDQAAQEDPDSPTLWTTIGNLHLQTSNPQEAMAAFDRAIALAPKHLPARYGRALAMVSAGQLGPAETALRELSREYPDSADVFASMGAILVKTGRPQEARPMFERALQLQPNHPQASNGLQQLDSLPR